MMIDTGLKQLGDKIKPLGDATHTVGCFVYLFFNSPSSRPR